MTNGGPFVNWRLRKWSTIATVGGHCGQRTTKHLILQLPEVPKLTALSPYATRYPVPEARKNGNPDPNPRRPSELTLNRPRTPQQPRNERRTWKMKISQRKPSCDEANVPEKQQRRPREMNSRTIYTPTRGRSAKKGSAPEAEEP